ncbi:MAG: dTDP-4-dehydrorhamnose 3,5-epimerase [Pseudomonadota bacterium]
MEIEKTDLPGVVVLTPRRFGDARGYFSEVWNKATLAQHGINLDFVQDNHSYSKDKAVLRGLHYQAPPHVQAKLVRCAAGAVWDVAVDARRGSPTYGQWAACELSAENGKQLLVPGGFLHGFLTLTPDAEVLYKCSGHYHGPSDGAVKWNSAELNIPWPLDGTPVLSDKDAAAPDFGVWQSPFEWSET